MVKTHMWHLLQTTNNHPNEIGMIYLVIERVRVLSSEILDFVQCRLAVHVAIDLVLTQKGRGEIEAGEHAEEFGPIC